MNNWKGNRKSTFSTLGASSHSNHEREKDDYYATDPKTIKPLFERESFQNFIWECACGEGYLSEAIAEHGGFVQSTDKVYRGFGEVEDFLKFTGEWEGDIITNPPYKFAQEFVEKAMSILKPERKLAMFLKVQFLEGQKRKEMFKIFPPKTIYIFSKRQKCALNGDFESLGSSAVAYAWFVWVKGFTGEPVVRWI